MARERELSEEKTQERQQKTLSLRISDVLHDRLERVRDVLSVKAGSRVTTSEVAKHLLESADEERLELPVRRADGLHDADLAAPFEDAHQHRVGDPERRDEQGHPGHSRHPAEDEQVGQPLALDHLDDRPAPQAKGFDLLDDLLDVPHVIHEQHRLVDTPLATGRVAEH